MVIFVAYEGFAHCKFLYFLTLKNKEKNTKAYFGVVGFVVILYILIAIVVVGALAF
jgi:heme/copper-type cytochrome/quinol oxidase subunit 4